MRLKIKVVPKSSISKIGEKMVDGSLKIKLCSAPIDNKANEELVKLLSKTYKKSKNKIKIVSGLTSRNKIVEIEN